MSRNIFLGNPYGNARPVTVTVVAECYDHSFEYLLDKSGTLYRRSLNISVGSEYGWEVTNIDQYAKPRYNARGYPL